MLARMTAIPAATPAEPMTGSPIVATTDLRRRYGEGPAAVDALAGVSVEIRRGEYTAIMGASGSGKSTLMHLMAGLDTPTAGTVTLDGVQLDELDDRRLTELRRDKVGFVFQAFNLLPVLTAEENLVLPLTIAGRKPDREWLESLVQTVGLGDRRASRSRGRSSQSRRSCSPTSRPATSTPPPRPRSSRSCAAPSTTSSRPSSWSPTTRPPRPTRTA
jgi:putative ABC transport system ATP-binding protein